MNVSPVYPHLPYVDAVHAALVDAGRQPEAVDVGTDDGGELQASFAWTGDLRLRWASGTGWRYSAGDCGGPLLVDVAADPGVLADVVAALADGREAPGSSAQWDGARLLEVALNAWDGGAR